MTHINNIFSIAAAGLHCFNSVCKNEIAYKNVADMGIQNRRQKSIRTVDGAPQSIDLHDYVPLFIARHTTMQYVITKPAPTKNRSARVTNRELAFILFDPMIVMNSPGSLIADGNAASIHSQFYRDPEGLSNINWEVVRSPNEYPQCYDRDWQRQKSAEILILDCILPSKILGIIVFSQDEINNLQRSPNIRNSSIAIWVDESYYM
ncbi:MAG: DUF4433 domain-containing protein [Candidatus Zixiibacteriota bacterium]